MRLGDLAKLVRSKNAGPFMLTIDVLFPDERSYEVARASSALRPGRIASLYGVPVEAIRAFEIPEFHAIKISFPRPVPSGGESDNDVYGCQYMARLAALDMDPGA